MGNDKVAYKIVPKDEKSKDGPDSPKRPKGFGARHVQTMLLFMSLTIGYAMRAQLSVSMVAMTNHKADSNITCVKNSVNDNTSLVADNATIVNRCEEENVTLGAWNVYRRYDWNKPTQEMIMFAFFVGYTSMMMPMGLLAQKFGGKRPILLALAVNGIVSIITPWVPIFGGWIGICICRLLQGASQAAFYPSIHTMLAKWAPLSERGRLSTYVYTGSPFGTILIFQIAGWFAGSPSLGWPATFWLCGILSWASFAMLLWLGASSPHEHPTISLEEMTFILEGGSADVVPKKRRTPWKSIVTSTAVWGLVASNAGSAAGYILVLTQIPTYMNHVLGVEIKKNGLLSSLPYLAMYITALMFGYSADYLANKKILSVTNIRRIANSIGMVISGLFLIGFSYITSTVPAVIVLICSMATHSAIHVGFHINQIDLAPNFAGPVMALGNMLANLTSLLVPVIVSNIVKDDVTNQQRWQIVFMIFAGLQFITNIIFVIFVKGEPQPWNFYGEDESGKEELSMNTTQEKNQSGNEKDETFKK